MKLDTADKNLPQGECANEFIALKKTFKSHFQLKKEFPFSIKKVRRT
jgi:hypothetical protein